MPLIAKYRLTWRGSVVEPGTVIDALNPDEARRLFELQRTRSVVFVPEEEGRFTDQPSDYIIRIPRGDGHFERVSHCRHPHQSALGLAEGHKALFCLES